MHKRYTMVKFLSKLFSIIVVLFFGIFIIEGLSPDFSLADTLSHFALTIVVLLIAFGSWKWPKIGGWFFVGLGIIFGFFFAPFIWAGLIIGGIVLLTGILFLLRGFNIVKEK